MKAGSEIEPSAESQEITVPSTCTSCGTANDADARFCKSCGTKLLAVLLALLSFATPAFAQFQMPDPKQMSGIPRPVTDLPAGHVSVRLIRGQLSNNIQVTRSRCTRVAKVLRQKPMRTDGGIQWCGCRNIREGGAVWMGASESQDFTWPADSGIQRDARGHAQRRCEPAARFSTRDRHVVFGDETRVNHRSGPDRYRCIPILDIQNSARAPVNPPAPSCSTCRRRASAPPSGWRPQALARGVFNRRSHHWTLSPGRTASSRIPHAVLVKRRDVWIRSEAGPQSRGFAVLMKKNRRYYAGRHRNFDRAGAGIRRRALRPLSRRGPPLRGGTLT